MQVALYKNKIPKSIYEVETGIACNCNCPICGNSLEAKNAGKEWDKPLAPGQKTAHFAHSDGSNCNGASESILHLMAKEVLKKTLSLKLPVLHYKGVQLKAKAIFNFDKCLLEKRVNIDNTFIQPDAILKKGKIELFIEFYKTHLVDVNKVGKIKKLNKSTIEIDLNEIPILKNGIVNKEEIRNNLVNKDTNRWWLHNRQQEKLYQKHLELQTQKQDTINEDNLIDDTDIFDDIGNFNSRYLNNRPIHNKENLEIWKKRLKQQGFKYKNIYKYPAYDYDFNGRKSFSHIWENLYCPKLKSNCSRKTIELSDCRVCEHHKSMMKNNEGEWGVACGY